MGSSIVVTGASRGIGAATARLAAARGFEVCINFRSERAAAEAIVAEIADAGGRAIAVGADMEVEADITAMFTRVDSELGPLVGLVNNAGRAASSAVRLADLSAADIDAVLRINVTGPMIAAREAIRRMSRRNGGGGGAIVNVGSLAAKHGAPGLWVHYAASKAALDTFTHGLALEVAGEGIRVNCVRPGLIDTPIHQRAGMPERVAKVGPRLPLGRAGTPEEVAAAILWLMSEEASYVTGAVVDVGGGA
ncbi:MAG: SDR family oxidoreductase [Hyphomicrobiaceae bacterium]